MKQSLFGFSLSYLLSQTDKSQNFVSIMFHSFLYNVLTKPCISIYTHIYFLIQLREYIYAKQSVISIKGKNMQQQHIGSNLKYQHFTHMLTISLSLPINVSSDISWTSSVSPGLEHSVSFGSKFSCPSYQLTFQTFSFFASFSFYFPLHALFSRSFLCSMQPIQDVFVFYIILIRFLSSANLLIIYYSVHLFNLLASP